MKKLLLFSAVISFLIICSCSEEEKKELKIRELSAFAYYVDTSWELNASAIVSGFEAEEIDDKKSIKLSYYVDMVAPSGELLEQVTDGMIDNTMEQDAKNAEIDVQLWMGDEFETGNYQLIFHVTDDLTASETNDTTDFVLEN